MSALATAGLEWTPLRAGIDPTRFHAGVMGPYRLGPIVRRTPLGEVVLAVHEAFDEVVELDRYLVLADTALAGPDGLLLGDIAHVVGLRHRHVAPLLGAGIDGGVPYVVRTHQLGRTLQQVFEAEVAIDAEVAAAVTQAVADALGYLAGEGPQPGVCAMGGFGDHDLFLGFDGSISLLGSGLRRVRAGDDDPIPRDLRSIRELASRFDARTGGHLSDLIGPADSIAQVADMIRRQHRAACGARAASLGRRLRAGFSDELATERAFFGLPALH